MDELMVLLQMKEDITKVINGYRSLLKSENKYISELALTHLETLNQDEYRLSRLLAVVAMS